MKSATIVRLLVPAVAVMTSLAAGSSGCAGTLEEPWRFTGDGGTAVCPDVPTAVFATTCATSGCHSTADKAAGLDLQTPGLASRVVGACANGGTGALVDPSHPAESVLNAKLGAKPPYGARMPFGKTPLDDATTACVLAWIGEQMGSGACSPDAGAYEDGGTPQ
jgi:hypothetical protein